MARLRARVCRAILVRSNRRPRGAADPRRRPRLFVGLHRNGAVDGFAYKAALGAPLTFLISTQLTRNWYSRLFFHGIGVTRTKDDGDRSANAAALARCIGTLRGGGRLFVFPEGTSSLGPRHLPFKAGAARLALDALDAGIALAVIPVGIHYDDPLAFRSRVEEVVGEPIALDLPNGLTPLERIKETRRRMAAALAEVGTNVDSEETQDRIRRLASTATLATPRSWFRSFKAWENGVPEDIVRAERDLARNAGGTRVWLHQEVPLFPMGSMAGTVAALALFLPWVALAALANLPPLMATALAGRRFPDGPNVVALWRILVGVPVFLLWTLALAAIAIASGHALAILALVAVDGFGLALWRRTHRLAVATRNAVFARKLRPAALAFRETVLSRLPS